MAVGSEDSLTGKLTFEEGMESASCVHVGEPWRSRCRYAGGKALWDEHTVTAWKERERQVRLCTIFPIARFQFFSALSHQQFLNVLVNFLLL